MALKGFKGKTKPKLQRTKYQVDSGSLNFSFTELLDIYLHAKKAEGVAEGTLNNKKNAVNIFKNFISPLSFHQKNISKPEINTG